MKYTIARQFSIKKEKFKIIKDSKTVCKVTASLSKEHKGQYNVKLTNPAPKCMGVDSCLIEPDSSTHTYSIYLQDGQTKDKTLFGQLSYQFCSYNNYLYTIIIGRKLYKVRSCDLKNRRLAIVDTVERDPPSPSNQYPTIQCPETLFQVIDSFSKSNKSYHVTINDKEKQFGYLAIVILLDLHERERA